MEELGQLLVILLKGLVLGFNWDAGADPDISERGGLGGLENLK